MFSAIIEKVERLERENAELRQSLNDLSRRLTTIESNKYAFDGIFDDFTFSQKLNEMIDDKVYDELNSESFSEYLNEAIDDKIETVFDNETFTDSLNEAIDERIGVEFSSETFTEFLNEAIDERVCEVIDEKVNDAKVGKSPVGEKDDLKEVPRHKKITDHCKKNVVTDVFSHVEDPRWIFLNAPENCDKYYYVRRGGPQQILPAKCVDCGPENLDNVLEPLGRFIRVELINPYYSNLRDTYIHYWIWFDNPNISRRVSENDQLFYTDHSPSA